MMCNTLAGNDVELLGISPGGPFRIENPVICIVIPSESKLSMFVWMAALCGVYLGVCGIVIQ